MRQTMEFANSIQKYSCHLECSELGWKGFEMDSLREMINDYHNNCESLGTGKMGVEIEGKILSDAERDG